MLLRISLFVAILAALAAGTLSYLEVTDKIPALTKQRDDEHSAKVTALTDLSNTKTKLAKTQSDLTQSQADLADTKSDRDKAVARAEAQVKRADELSVKLARATQERDDAQNELASFKATGLSPEQIVKLNKTLKDARSEIEAINGEKTVLEHEKARLQTRLDRYEGTNAFVMLRANIGDDQGVLPDGEMLVSRDGKLVAKVIVRSVQKDRSIANIVPGWKLGEPVEGDEVSPAHPAI